MQEEKTPIKAIAAPAILTPLASLINSSLSLFIKPAATNKMMPRIIFVSETGPKVDRKKRLAVMDQDGYGVKYLTLGNELVLTPRFSPASQHVTYMSYFKNLPRVYLLNIETGIQDLVGDFPGGSAYTLYQSIQKILAYPDSTRLFMCHDYPPAGRPIANETTVGEQKKKNIHIHDGISEEQFVEMRNKRDKTLEMPILILPSIQINVRAGHRPPVESNGKSYLKIPLDVL